MTSRTTTTTTATKIMTGTLHRLFCVLLLGLFLLCTTLPTIGRLRSKSSHLLASDYDFSFTTATIFQSEQQHNGIDTTPNHRGGNIGPSPDRSAKTVVVSQTATTTIQHGEQQLDGTMIRCFRWNDTDSDRWWAMHPEWEATTTNEQELCFGRIRDANKAALFRKLHDIQYNAPNCSNVATGWMSSSGFSKDMNDVGKALLFAITYKRPIQIALKPGKLWHYAGFKDKYRNGRDPVCPEGNMFCYFLPFGACPPSTTARVVHERKREKEYRELRSWLREYATRPQQWLRYRIMEYSSKAIRPQQQQQQGRCAVFHVRRSDVVLHGKFSRKYLSIAEYLEKLKEGFPAVKDILLFTDDANAIEEAQDLHPEYNWMYLEKKRHRGSEGGFENHLPSDSPEEEVVAILSELQLAKRCDILVHGVSGYAGLIGDSMAADGRTITRLLVKAVGPNLSLENKQSESELQHLLEGKKSPNSTKLQFLS